MTANPTIAAVARAAGKTAAALGALPTEPAADLSELLSDAPVPATERERFTVHDERSADWVLGKLAALEAEEGQILAFTAIRVKEIQADRARLLSRFEGELRTWGEGEKERRNRQTVTLPHGQIVFRKSDKTFRLVDPVVALADAEERGLVRTIEAVSAQPERVEVDAAAYIKWAKDTGEALAGLEAVPEQETCKIVAGTKAPKDQKEGTT